MKGHVILTYLINLLCTFMVTTMAVDLQYGLTCIAITVSPVTDEGVCVQKPPFFTNIINRGLHSSETVKVCVDRILYIFWKRYT